MKNLIERAKSVTEGEDGATFVEIVVIIAIILVIAIAAYALRDSISNFLNDSAGNIDTMNRGQDLSE